MESRKQGAQEKVTSRCPKCEWVALEKYGADMPYTSFFPGLSDEYFVCHNPECDVARIYGDNAVMVSSR